jgi:hypothetical protein
MAPQEKTETFVTCPICQRLYFSRFKHTCPPAWLVYPHLDGYSEKDAVKIYAATPQDAAIEYADGWDSSNHMLLDGGFELDVIVISPHGAIRIFTIAGEAVPHYRIVDEKNHRIINV